MALPFGPRSATIACQCTIKEAAFILNNHGILADVYINDFYGGTPQASLHTTTPYMNIMLSELGLQALPDKDIPPCCEMIRLSVQINTTGSFNSPSVSSSRITRGALELLLVDQNILH